MYVECRYQYSGGYRSECNLPSSFVASFKKRDRRASSYLNNITSRRAEWTDRISSGYCASSL